MIGSLIFDSEVVRGYRVVALRVVGNKKIIPGSARCDLTLPRKNPSGGDNFATIPFSHAA
jgi:hypothetical protein